MMHDPFIVVWPFRMDVVEMYIVWIGKNSFTNEKSQRNMCSGRTKGCILLYSIMKSCIASKRFRYAFE